MFLVEIWVSVYMKQAWALTVKIQLQNVMRNLHQKY